MDYKILSDSFLPELEEKVLKALKEGWELAGGVSSSSDQYGITYYQAIFYKPNA